MVYEELVARVRKAMKMVQVSREVGHLAYQFNVEGEGEGYFYVELDNGKVNVMPYEYYDRDLIVVTTAEVILQMLEGKITPRVAYTNGQLRVYGDSRMLENLPFGSGGKAEFARETM